MEHYLDNAATTQCLKECSEVMSEVLLTHYGNPSSLHSKGVVAENYIKEAKRTIASYLHIKEKEIIFTSGGTESNNLAIIGAARANKRNGMHIITSSIEHASVLDTMTYLHSEGFDITYLPVDSQGRISLKDLANAIQNDTILVSLMYVNNEVGSIQPIQEAGKIIKQASEKILFHVDAVQAFGKIDFTPRQSHIDLLSASSHKIHGPKGCGFLYVKDKVKLAPLLYGGGQENMLRSGTQNVPGIAAMHVATKYAYENMKATEGNVKDLKNDLLEKLQSIDGIELNGSNDGMSSPYILNISIQDIASEVMLHALEDKGIYVSTRSACSSHKKKRSDTLSAMGLSKERIDSALRISFSSFTTKEDTQMCYNTIKELTPLLRKYKRA